VYRSLLLLALATTVSAPECGTSTPVTAGPGATNNVQSIVLNSGPANNYVNGAFTSATICVPGSASGCQTIDGLLVDTGSSGLRVLASVLTLTLPQQTASGGSALFECNQFLDGYTWGAVRTTDLKIAGESAASLPMQVIGGSQIPAAPSDCTSGGLTAEDTLDSLGANGVLGVGEFRQDCGLGCSLTGASNPGLYYACNGNNCQATTASLTQQLQNPVWLFGSDNNGVLIQIPQVAASGAVTTTGSLIFGIGTQSNNALGSARILTTDANGNIQTLYNGQTYGQSFIDSGSNGYFFLDSATTGLPICPDTSDFYCPSSPVSVSATQIGANRISVPVTFTVDNADTLLGNLALSVFPTLGGPSAGNFDYGLPFFFGKRVYTAIEGQSTPGGIGPYWAF
jgi:hypothetical protein